MSPSFAASFTIFRLHNRSCDHEDSIEIGGGSPREDPGETQLALGFEVSNLYLTEDNEQKKSSA